jgi:gliding motility-associated-like protein
VVTGNDLLFRWTPPSYLNNDQVQSPLTTPLADITYLLTVTARGGCAASDDVFVKMLKTPNIPNVFSPNNDGINDTWIISYLESYPGATVDVFNRSGQPVFSSAGYDTPWNGTLKGAPLPVGTYYYIINPKNGRKPMSGSVTLLR